MTDGLNGRGTTCGLDFLNDGAKSLLVITSNPDLDQLVILKAALDFLHRPLCDPVLPNLNHRVQLVSQSPQEFDLLSVQRTQLSPRPKVQ